MALISSHLDPQVDAGEDSELQSFYSSDAGYRLKTCQDLLLLSDETADSAEMQAAERLAIKDAAAALEDLRKLANPNGASVSSTLAKSFPKKSL